MVKLFNFDAVTVILKYCASNCLRCLFCAEFMVLQRKKKNRMRNVDIQSALSIEKDIVG